MATKKHYETTDRSALRYLIKRRMRAHDSKMEYLVIDSPSIFDFKINVHWSENKRHATTWDCGATAVAFAGCYTIAMGCALDIEVDVKR